MGLRGIRVDVQTVAQQVEGSIGVSSLPLNDGIEEELVVFPLVFCG